MAGPVSNRIPEPPQGLGNPVLYTYLAEVARRLNQEAYVSRFSGTNPNVSAVTGVPGNLVVNIGSASDNSRLWVKSGSTVRSSTTGWKQMGLGGSGGGDWTIVKKTGDSTRTSTDSLTNDPHLQVALDTGVHTVRGRAWITVGNATMDYKYGFNFSGSIDGAIVSRRHSAGGAGAGTDIEDSLTTTYTSSGLTPGGTSTAVTAATSGIGGVEFEMQINVTSSGTLAFVWAQNTSDSGNLTVWTGAYMEYTSF